MAKPKSHAQKLKELTDAPSQDFDPEDIGSYGSDSEESDTHFDAAPNSAREHYETVGKSRLRKSHAVSLGPQYAGSKVRREAIDEDEDEGNDPFSRDFSESESGEEDVGEEDSVSEDEEGEEILNGFGHSSEEDDDDSENTDLTNDDNDMDNGSDPTTKQTADGIIDRSELRKLMADDQKSVAATLFQSAKADAEKGKAVKAQRATFDALLNSRIKLQKALIATNSMLAAEQGVDKQDTEQDVVEAAEAAALTLWNNLNGLRSTLQESKSGQKRSHKRFTREDSLDAMWKEAKSYEVIQKKPRTTALDFWASKTRATTALPQARGRLQQPVKEQQLSDVLAGQMTDMSRLVAKTQVARSCAPIQAASASTKPAVASGTPNGAEQDNPEEEYAETAQKLSIYDDADFYTILLSSLISQRSTDTATVNLSNLSLQPWQAAREARTKKVVDTKASKGRKLRYTVHERLVSFMAPEDRGSWGERQADELFGSLFGRRLALAEDDGVDEDMEEDRELEGLRLFGGR